MNEQKLDLILAELGKLNGRMTSVEGGITSIEGSMTSMEGRMSSMEGRMTSMETRMESLEAGQCELNQIVTAIRDRQDETAAKLEALTMDVHKLHGELAGVKETMVTVSDLKFYDLKIAEHDRAIYQIKKNAVDSLFGK